MYRIVYLWKGEQHTSLIKPSDRAEANRIVKLFQDQGWKAWVEG